MRQLLMLTFLVIILGSCKTKKALTIAPEMETEFRDLDTLVVTAPKPDEFKAPEEFKLPRYNPSHTRLHDLIHTKLDLRFNWEEEKVIGQATLILKPYFYETSVLTLDAKGFEFHEVRFSNSKTPLKYEYDGNQIIIDLGKKFNRNQEFELFIDYTASPAESGGSAAITSDQGLFFINPRGEDGDKPQQIWTQGETENNSRWFPTIDKPNERCTQEMYLTVEDRYKTLSNGVFINATKNEDGTRTDYWKMDMPHAPYLFMIAVGEYAIVREDWNGKPVEYYVEPKYEAYAKNIFPHTPEMLSFFSDILGVEYPWQKYSQVVVRDYVSGAMENTTGVIFGEFMQGTDRELLDNLTNDKIVAHEMFHHWFGDMVTCESWANLTLNEGFANYSEYLWLEHKYGKDEADFHLLNELRGYVASAQNDMHPLIHFGHADKEDMFDAHSYNKGGLVLHMLRNEIGDDAFFAGLKKYLTDNAYSDVESHELRMAFEDVVGEDLNWFFDQWFFEAGHPQMEVSYDYDEISKIVNVTIEQTQSPEVSTPIFQMPVAIDVYIEGQTPTRHDVMINDRVETFSFQAPTRPKLVNFDADKILLGEKSENKTVEEFVYQYLNAPKFLDRYEALSNLKDSENSIAQTIFKKALNDDFWVLRAIAISSVNLDDEALAIIAKLAEKDKHSHVRTAALDKLGGSGSPKYASVAKQAIEKDPANHVVSAGLQALVKLDKTAALDIAKKLEHSESGEILEAVGEIYVESGDPTYMSYFEKNWDKIAGWGAIGFIDNYSKLAAKADVVTLLNAASKLKTIGTDMGVSPWRRFGAMNGVNNLHGALYEQIEATEDATIKADLQAKDSEVLEIIEAIKKAEENDRLKAMYGRFPAPAPRP